MVVELAVAFEKAFVSARCHHRLILHRQCTDQLIGPAERRFDAEGPAPFRRAERLNIAAEVNQAEGFALFAQVIAHPVGNVAFGDGPEINFHARFGQEYAAGRIVE
ncbi:hypothetical protein D3C72_1474170 [compost metagenome]